jgi:dihydroxyacetone kinase-like predicted kinase
MQKYSLEFILHTQNSQLEAVKNSLSEFGDSLEIAELLLKNSTKGKDFKININTEDPTVIFDICAQIGRIRSAKVNEIK